MNITAPSISFIIPYYNVERPILERCLKSVAAVGAASPRLDWEVWLIDDGTPHFDAQEWLAAFNEPRFHYHRKNNGGASSARNAALELATKEYVHFLDSDDYLNLPPTLVALQLLSANRPDLLKFTYHKVFDAQKTTAEAGEAKRARAVEQSPGPKNETTRATAAPLGHHETRAGESNGRMEATAAPLGHEAQAPEEHIKFRGSGADFLMRYNLRCTVWSYFVKRAAIGNLRFTPGIVVEDEEFTPLLIAPLHDIIVTDLHVYAYYQRAGSVMHPDSPAKLSKMFTDFLGVMTRLRAACAPESGCRPAPDAEAPSSATAAPPLPVHADEAAEANHAAPTFGQAPEKIKSALSRRLGMLESDFVYGLITRSPSSHFLKRHLAEAQRLRLYPPRLVRPDFKQRIFNIFASHPSLLPPLALVFKLIKRRQSK